MKEVYEFFELIYSCADPEWFIEIRKLEPLPGTSFWDRVRNLREWTAKGLEITKTADSLHFRVVPSKIRDRRTLPWPRRCGRTSNACCPKKKGSA